MTECKTCRGEGLIVDVRKDGDVYTVTGERPCPDCSTTPTKMVDDSAPNNVTGNTPSADPGSSPGSGQTDSAVDDLMTVLRALIATGDPIKAVEYGNALDVGIRQLARELEQWRQGERRWVPRELRDRAEKAEAENKRLKELSVFMAERLVHKYGESPNLDYIQAALKGGGDDA